MAKTAKLTLIIAGDNKGATSAIAGTEKKLTGLGGAASAVGDKIAGAFSLAAVVAFSKKAFSAADDYSKQVATIKRLTGESAENASALAVGAQRAGVDATKAAQSYGILASNIKNGKVEAEGIATKDSNGNLLSFDEILRNVADHLAKLPAGYQRAAAARALFGRGGAEMVKMLQDGSAALDENARAAQEAGMVLSDADLNQWGEYRKAVRDLKREFTGLQITLTQSVVPALTGLLKVTKPVVTQARMLANMYRGIGNAWGAVGAQIRGEALPALSMVADEIDKATKKVQEQNKPLDENEEHWRRTSKAVHDASAAEKQFDKQVKANDAFASLADAQEELADARKAAAGASDEYQAAIKQEQEDARQLVEDEQAVAEAKADSLKAQEELTKAREEAADRVRDLKDAVVEQRMAERDATLSLHEAEQEYRRTLADPGSTKLDKERAAVGLADAQDKLRLTTEDRAKAERDAARATVENDEGVIAAHQRVKDANEAIVAAQQRVKDQQAVVAADGVAKQKLLEEAALKVRDAQRAVEDATVDAATALRELVTSQQGPLAGWKAYADVLGSIKGASPEVTRLLGEVNRVILEAMPDGPVITPITGATATVPGTANRININPDGSYGGPRKGKVGNLVGNGGGVTVNVTVNGSPREHGRAVGNAAAGAVGGILRGGR